MNLTPSVSHLNTGNPAVFSTKQKKDPMFLVGVGSGRQEGCCIQDQVACFGMKVYMVLYEDLCHSGCTYLTIKWNSAMELYKMWKNTKSTKGLEALSGNKNFMGK